MVVALGVGPPRRPPSTGCPGRRARRRWRPAARCAPLCRGRCRSRSSSAASTPNAPYIPASRSPIGTPTRVGSSGPGRSATSARPHPGRSGRSPARPPSGPSWPNPVMDSTTRRGLSSAGGRRRSRAGRARPAGSSPAAHRPARSARQRTWPSRSSGPAARIPCSGCRTGSRSTPGASSGPTNGGPQPLVSSPVPGVSTLITRGPEVTQHHAGVRPGQGSGQVDDQAVQRPGRVIHRHGPEA